MALSDDFLFLARANDDGNIVDVTGNHTITNSGDGVTTGVLVGDADSGPFTGSRAMVFDGSSYLSIADTPAFDFDSEFTVDFWAKRTRSGIREIPICKSANNNSASAYISHMFDFNTDNSSRAILGDGSTYYLATGTAISNTDWNHICYRRRIDITDNNNLKLSVVINGTSGSEITMNTSLYDNVGPFIIGAWIYNSVLQNPFIGSIAELAIRNIAVDPAEFPPTKPYGLQEKRYLIDGLERGLVI